MKSSAVKTASLLVLLLLSFAAAGCGGSSGPDTPQSPSLRSIAVSPSNAVIVKGGSRQFTATGTFADNSTQDMTAAVLWSSSSSTVATISNAPGSNGLASTVDMGSTVITAASGSISGSANLMVTAAALTAIAVTPANPHIITGNPLQFTATGTFSDNTTQDITTTSLWSSSSISVAAVSNAPGSIGLATPLMSGSTTLTATAGSLSGSTLLTVTAQSSVDMWQTFDLATLDAASLAANAHTSLGSWNIDNAGDASTSLSGEKAAPAIFNGISDAGGTRGLAYVNNGTAYRHGAVQYTFDMHKTSFTTGFWLYVPSGMTGFFGEHDVLCINTNISGTDTYLKLGDPDGTEMRLRSFIYGSGGYSTGYVVLPQNAWYWIAVDYRNNDTVVFDVYDGNLALVGSVDHAPDGPTPNDEIKGMWIGSIIGASDAGMSGTIYWDDWVVNWTNPKHPIGLVP